MALLKDSDTVIGGKCPSGFYLIGHVCPRDPTCRCPICETDDEIIPSKCGYGDPVYRRQKEEGDAKNAA